jgi:hypothetical protein
LGAAAFGLGLPVAIIGAISHTLMRRRYLAAALVILCSPFMPAFAMGVVNYWQGNARLQSGPRSRFCNPDPELRCPRRSDTSCFLTGFEYMREPTYDVGVRMMTKMFGPMRGTYTGPYPTEMEAQAALQSAEVVATKQVMEDCLTIGGCEYALDHELGSTLLSQECTSWGWGSAGPHQHLTATVWQDECLLLRIPLVYRLALQSGPPVPSSALIVLICRENGRPFAYYLEGDRYTPVYPPIYWWHK